MIVSLQENPSCEISSTPTKNWREQVKVRSSSKKQEEEFCRSSFFKFPAKSMAERYSVHTDQGKRNDDISSVRFGYLIQL